MSCYSEFGFYGGTCPITNPPPFGSYWGGQGNQIGRLCEVIQGPGAGRLVAGTGREVPDIVENGITYKFAGVACTMYHNGAFRHALSRPSYVWFWLHFVPEGMTYPEGARGGFLVAKVCEAPESTGFGVPDFVFEPGAPWLTDDVWDHKDKLVADRTGYRTFVGDDTVGWLTTAGTKVKVKAYVIGQKSASNYQWDNPSTQVGTTKVAMISRHCFPYALGVKTTVTSTHPGGNYKTVSHEAYIGDVRLSDGGLKVPPSWQGLGLAPSAAIKPKSPANLDDGKNHLPAGAARFFVVDWDLTGEPQYSFDNTGEINDVQILFDDYGVYSSGSESSILVDDLDAGKKLAWHQASATGAAVDTQGALFVITAWSDRGFGGFSTGTGGASRAVSSPTRASGTIHPMGKVGLAFQGPGVSNGFDPVTKVHTYLAQQRFGQGEGGRYFLAPNFGWEGLGSLATGENSSKPPENCYQVGLHPNQALASGVRVEDPDLSGPLPKEGFSLVVGQGGLLPLFWRPGLSEDSQIRINFGVSVVDGATDWQGLKWHQGKIIAGKTSEHVIGPDEQELIFSEGFIAFFGSATNARSGKALGGDLSDPLRYNVIFPLYDKSDGLLRPGKPPKGFYIDASGVKRDGSLAVQGQMDSVHPTKAWIKEGFVA